MILSDRTIREEIQAGRIEIDPFEPSAVQPSSVDVRVASLFRVFHNARYPYIDVKKEMEDLTELVEVPDGEAFILHPGEFVLIHARAGPAPRRRRCQAGGEVLTGATGAAHSLDRRLRRPRMGRRPHA